MVWTFTIYFWMLFFAAAPIVMMAMRMMTMAIGNGDCDDAAFG